MTDAPEAEEAEAPKSVSDKQGNGLAKTIIALLVIVGMLLSFNIWYTNNAVHKSNQLFCALFVATDDRYRALPSTADPEALKFGRLIHDLRVGLDCKETEVKLPPLPSRTPSSLPSTSSSPSSTGG